ncbi:GH92 family glycosyl hydrolase, partial [Crocinitomix catalasitica]|uniref:GH92 family glycosyl hydrolase n=1 Tax=Crocinitomix catalasitica TaxID=184607 RepID=UPI000488B09A
NESESVSKTLEYAYDDWCIAIFADSLGHDSIASIFYKRAQYYKNLYHPDSKFMQPRFNGGWKDNFKPSEVTFDFTEANSWQYSLFVPQDINGLIELLGGADSLELWLDNLFSAKPETTGRHQVDITGLIGQYAHGNEPSHHMAYLYNFTHSPWKTNHYVNRIFNEMYSNAPDGLSGNEDCGQMSSWYVLSALGFYSLTPGSDYYALGCPRYKLANLSLENGKEFRVIAENLTEKNIYIESIYINGSKVDRNFIRHSEIMAGGELKFIMTNSKTDIAFKEMPLTKIYNQPFLRAPTLSNSVVPFTKKKVIKFEHIADSTEIRYTLDGSEPLSNSKKYKAKGIKIKETTTLKAISVKQSLQSLPTTAYFVLTNNDWSIKLKSTFHDHYSGGGERALIDQIYGNTDFRTGSWQGFFDQDLDVEIDLGKIQDINSIGINLLQDAKSWIWYPSEVSFQISNDGIEWFTLGTVLNEFPRTQLGSFIQPFKLDKTVSTRFIRIIAKNPGPCPEWHPGAGNPSYIFADEISID